MGVFNPTNEFFLQGMRAVLVRPDSFIESVTPFEIRARRDDSEAFESRGFTGRAIRAYSL